MDLNNAIKVAKNMNLEIGKPLTDIQIASLDEDMVWMVETEVDDETVLAPVVYLASATRELFDAGNANIIADDIDLNGTQFASSGNIQGSNTLSIRTNGDITNVGGSISGGDVLLASTDGDVNNIRTTRDRTFYGTDRTLLNDMASMEALNNLTVAAGGDVNNIGGTMSVTSSNGDGLRIQAGNNINFTTVTTSHSFTGSNGRASNSTTHHSSNVYSASDIMMYAGNDANFTALNMNSSGNMGIGAGNDVNLLNAYNESYSRSEKKTKSCYLCNGSIKSKKTTQTESYSRQSVGNNFTSGGDMNLNAGNDILSIGSQLHSAGSMTLSADNNIYLQSAQNIETTKTNTTVERMGAFTSSHEANASGASASSGAEGRFAINETTNLVDTNTKIRNTGNGLNSGADLVLDSGNDITIIGGDLKAEETVGMRGHNITNMASEDVDINTSTMKQNSTGLYVSGQAGASGASNVGGNSGADASVEAGLYTNQTSSSSVSGSTTANTTKIEGKNVVREARGTMTDIGTNITAQENISNTAKDARFMAAENTTFDSSQTTTHEGKIGAFAEAGGNTGGVDAAGQGEEGGASGSGAVTKADAGAGKGVKASYDYSHQQSESSTSTAVTGSMNAGGSINNKTDGHMVFEGTAMQAVDAINIDADSVTFDAARDKSQSSENSESLGVEVKASKKDVSASGVAGFSRKDENSDSAVAGSMNAGSGGINITTTGNQSYEGTDIQTEGDLNRISTSGGDIKDNEAKSTSSKSETTVNFGSDTSGNMSGDGTYINEEKETSEPGIRE
jgi:hypothetical protein